MKIVFVPIIKNQKAYTMIEVIITVVILSIVAAFASIQYKNVLEKAEQENIVSVLGAAHVLIEIYKTNSGEYWPAVSETNLTTINNKFGTLFYPIDGFRIEYDAPDLIKGHAWNIEVEHIGTNPNNDDWEIRVRNGPLSADNPCCDPDTDPPDVCKIKICDSAL